MKKDYEGRIQKIVGMSLKREKFMAQKGLLDVARRRCCRTEVHCLRKEETFIVSECKAMHEENFLCNWVREDLEGIEKGGRTEKG